MTKIDTYLFFDGNCGDAMRFYERVLGGTLKIVPADQVPGGNPDQVMHAHLDADGAVLLASDWMDTTPFPGKQGFSVTLSVDSVDRAKQLFEGLSDGGKVTSPFDKTFFSDGFGMLVDRYGTPWMVMAERAGS